MGVERLDPPGAAVHVVHDAAAAARATGCRGAGRRSTTASCATVLWAQCGDARFETAKVHGARRAADGEIVVQTDRGDLTAPLVVDALGWRRVLASPHYQPPDAPLSRGLEVHPPHDGSGDALDVWIERGVVARGYGWRVPAERRGARSARCPTTRATACASRSSSWPRKLERRAARRLPGQLVPAPLRDAVEDGVFFVGDSAGHCLPLSGEGIRTAFYFGVAAGRELRAVLDGRAGHASARSRATRAFHDGHRRTFAWALLLQRVIPALPPRLLTLVLRVIGAPATDRPLVRLVHATRRPRRSPTPAPPRAPRRSPRSRPASARCLNQARMEIAYDERGLVPVVIQDWSSGEVLTLAYANARGARQRTRETGELHLWSRSRDELWHKGATSGNVAARPRAAPGLRRRRGARARRAGRARLPHRRALAASSTGELEPPAPHEALPGLERTLADRAAERPEGSYTVHAARRPAADRREGPGGGRGGRARRARGVRRARRRRGRRRPLPPDRAAAQPRPQRWPTPSACCIARAAERDAVRVPRSAGRIRDPAT